MNVGEEVRGVDLERAPAREKAETNASDLLPPRLPLIDLTVPGEPLAAPRMNVPLHGRGVYYPRNYVDRRDAIAMLMKTARIRREPSTGLVELRCVFHRGHRRRSDFDNFLKPIGDAGNGILWVDDSQIVAGSWDIDWGMPARTEIRAWVIGGW